MRELVWSTDPVGFYRHLHPRPVLLTVCAPPKTGGKLHQLGSITDPSVIAPTGILSDPQYSAVWWTVCGQRPCKGRTQRPQAMRPGWGTLNRDNNDTDKDRVDTLSACWVDLDLKDKAHQTGPYREQGLTRYEVFVPAMLALAESKGLPSPTLAMRSGRGLWLYWRLVDEQGQPVVDDGGPTWKRVLDLLERLIACFPGLADAGVKDRKRQMRIPGCSHPEGHVTDWAQVSGRAYTLDEMDASVPRLSPAAVRAQRRVRKAAGALPPAPPGDAGAIGPLPSFDDLDPGVYGKVLSSRARLLKDIRGLYKLARHRGGMAEGIRHYTLLVALTALRHLYPTKRDSWLSKLWQINLDICRPPQPAEDVASMVDRAIRQATTRESTRGTGMDAILPTTGPGPLPYPAIWDLIRVTDEEREQLNVFEYEREPTPPDLRGRIREEDLRIEAILRGMLARGEWGQGVIPSITAATATLESIGERTKRGKPFGRERVRRALHGALRFPADTL